MSAEGQKGDLAMAEWLEAIGVTWLTSRAGGGVCRYLLVLDKVNSGERAQNVPNRWGAQAIPN